MEERLLTTKEAMDLLQVTRRTLYSMAEKGRIRKTVFNNGHAAFYIPENIAKYYDPKTTMTVKGVCSLLSCSRGTVHRYVQRGFLLPIPHKGKLPVRFLKRNVEEFYSWFFSPVKEGGRC